MALHWCATPCGIGGPWPPPLTCNVASREYHFGRTASQNWRIDRWKQLDWRSAWSSSAFRCTPRLSCVYFSGAGQGLTIYAKKWWEKKEQSKLKEDSPLPLPLAYPSPKPFTKEDIDKQKACDPEQEYCKPVVYQWTGKCKSCQGTGEVSFRRKKGREVISKCIACHGIGSVLNITRRDDIKVMDEADPE